MKSLFIIKNCQMVLSTQLHEKISGRDEKFTEHKDNKSVLTNWI